MTPETKARVQRSLLSSSGRELWAAASELGAHVDSDPEGVWAVLVSSGANAVGDTKTALTLCVLEPLLARHFSAIFPRVRQLADQDPLFADLVVHCRKVEEAEQGDNSREFDELRSRLRTKLEPPVPGGAVKARWERWNRLRVGIGACIALHIIGGTIFVMTARNTWLFGLLGITQTLYVVPAALLAEAVGLSRVTKGLIIGCVATFLLWTVACAVTLLSLNANLS